MSYKANYRVDTTAKSFHIIERIGELGSAGVSELGDDLDMSKSIVHNHLSTLRELGYVIKERDRYRLSLRFLDIGHRRADDLRRFQYIESAIVDITSRFDTVAYVVERDVDEGVVTYAIDESATGTKTYSAGERLSLTESPLGIALLAELPKEEREAVLEQSQTDRPDVEESIRRATGQNTVVWNDDDGESETLVTLGVCREPAYGVSIGVGVSVAAGARTVEEIKNAVESLATEINGPDGGNENERSFTTMKHHWFSN